MCIGIYIGLFFFFLKKLFSKNRHIGYKCENGKVTYQEENVKKNTSCDFQTKNIIKEDNLG